MDVEVEVVTEHRQTFLVVGVRSLEEGERIATEMAQHRGALSTRVPKRWSRIKETFVAWSQPVIVRDGEILRDER